MCTKIAYASQPYIQLYNAIRCADSDSKDYVRWKINPHIDPSPFNWISNSMRILKPGGKLDCIITQGFIGDIVNFIEGLMSKTWYINFCPKCGDLLVEVTK